MASCKMLEETARFKLVFYTGRDETERKGVHTRWCCPVCTVT